MAGAAFARAAGPGSTGATAPFTFSIVSGALPPGLSISAAGVISGTPGAAGSYTFGVRVLDANQMSATATLTIRVFEPLVVPSTTLTQGAVNQVYTASVSASGGFAPYNWAIASGALPTGLALSPAGAITGSPTQSGVFTFTASATDGAIPAQVNSGTIALNVAPAANAQNVTLAENAVTPITLSGTGAAAGAFTFAIGNPPAHGAVTLNGATATYTPASNFNGPDSFTFRVTQNGLSSAFAAVSLTVTPVNQAPTANPQTVFTHQGSLVDFVLTGRDVEDSPLTYAIVTNPAHGTLSVTPGNPANGPFRRYTPANGYQGTDSFTFRVNDGALNSPNATVSITVGNPPPGTADVSVTLTDAPDPAVLGNVVTSTATVRNSDIITPAATNLHRPVAYYFENQGLGVDQWSGHPLEAWMNNLGNPWIWWTSIPCLLLMPYFIFRHRSFPAALIAVGFLTQYLPWTRITRVIFLYHMFGGLIFMVLALAFVLGRLAATPGFSVQLGETSRVAVSGRALAYGHLVITVLFFLYFYPLWTGLPMGDTALLGGFPGGKAWFPRWV